MASALTHEQQDALYRARGEINLLMGQYSRRLKRTAENIALAAMIDDPSADPNEVGKAAFLEAGKRLGVLDEAAAPAALGA